MPAKKLRVVIDTNLWISFLISKQFNSLDKLFATARLTLLFSEELLDEFIEVAKRPKFRKYFTLNDLIILLNQIHAKAEFIDVTSDVNICRDEKDNFLISLAIDSKADFLITGDKDLLEIQKFEKTRILTMSEFLTIEN